MFAVFRGLSCAKAIRLILPGCRGQNEDQWREVIGVFRQDGRENFEPCVSGMGQFTIIGGL